MIEDQLTPEERSVLEAGATGADPRGEWCSSKAPTP